MGVLGKTDCELCNDSGVFFEPTGETIMELCEIMHYCTCAKGRDFKAIAQRPTASTPKAVVLNSGRDKRLGQNNEN